MRNEDDAGGRARVTTGASVTRRLNRDYVMQIRRLGGCEDFISE